MNKTEDVFGYNPKQLENNLSCFIPNELPTFMSPEEFLQASITTEVLKINEAMEKSLIEGSWHITYPKELHRWVRGELEALGWKVEYQGGDTYVIYMQEIFFSNYEANLAIEKRHDESKHVLFMTPEEYYKKLKEVQIKLVKNEIDDAIKRANLYCYLSTDILPVIINDLEKAGWQTRFSNDRRVLELKYLFGLEKLNKQAIENAVLNARNKAKNEVVL